MKPNFALNITDTAISLLHRTSRGWLEVGSAAFDTPDLDEALGYLRASALGLSPHGVTTKLILPPGQILYTEVDVTGPDKAAREAQIRTALEGRTPYAVEDLVFDWWGTGPTVKVAVVARETLDEAEAFAEAHRFNPVSFVTTPAEGQFAGEPWFGVTKLSASLLPEGEKVTRDQDPVKVVTRETPKAESSKPDAKPADDTALAKEAEAKAKAAADKVAKEKEDAAKDAIEAANRDAAAKREADAANAAKEAETAALAAAEAAKRAQAEAEKAAAEKASADASADAIRKTEAAKAEMERRAQELAQAEAKRLVEEAEKAKAAQMEREKAKAALIEAERKRSEAEAAFTGVTAPGIADPKDSAPQPPAPSFASRRRDEAPVPPSVGPASAPQSTTPAPPTAATPGAAPPAPPVMAPPAGGAAAPVAGAGAAAETPKGPAAPTITSVVAPKQAPTAPVAGKAAAPGATAPMGTKAPVKQLNGTAAFATGAKANLAQPAAQSGGKGVAAAMVTAARIPGTGAALSRFKNKVQTKAEAPSKMGRAAVAAGATGDASMGKFGAKLAPRRGKPRFLGLILTLVLLAVLAAVAAWSSLYLSRDETAPEAVQQAGTPPPVAPVASDTPAVVAPNWAENVPQAAPDAANGAVTEAEAAADAEAELPPVQDLASAEQPVAVPPPEAMLADVLPDVSSIETTAQATGSGRGPQDEIFLAGTDGAQPAFDAVALPRPQTRPDAAPAAVLPPPPFGTQYEFDADGTIKATANGVVMPGGFWLIAAQPPKVPPARPAAISDPVVVAPVAPDANAAATPPPDSAAAEAAGASTAGISRMEGTGPSFTFAPDTTVANRRPKTRPDIPEPVVAPVTDPAADPAAVQAEDDAALVKDPSLLRLASLRPRVRPNTVVVAAEEARAAAAAASLAAQAAAKEKVEQDNALAVALSPRPAARPRDFSRAVEAAIAAATRETPRRVAAAATAPAPKDVPDAEEAEEPEVKVSAAPRIPTRANVAKQATFKNAINLSKTNLIGVYGTDNKRYALIRSSSGRYTKVRVGDRLDGGTVAAITRDEVRYKKGSKMLALSMPKG